MPKVKRLVSVSDMICEALLRLIEAGEKPYNEITIQDVVDEAGVCRNSFYRNYRSMDDVFRKKFMEICGESDPEDMVRDGLDYFDVFQSACLQYQKHRRFFQCYYKANPKSYFDTISSRVILSNTTQEVVGLSSEEYYTYACRAWIGIGLTTEWLGRGCDVSAEELTEILRHFVLK